MLDTHCFYDLCIQESFFCKDNLEDSLKLLYDYGYRTVAINQIIEHESTELKKKKKKGEPREIVDVVPLPINLDKLKEIMVKLGLHNFKILNRLTIEFSNQDVLHKITKSANYKYYDLVAALPTTNQALLFTCSTFEADIFSFNAENKFGLRLNRKMYNQLMERGYHFELLYTPTITDCTKRKNMIHVAHLYHSFGKSKNIIFSSGADNCIHIRSPYDVINLGFMFGLSTLQSKTSITHYPQKVILNAVGRRHGKAVMFLENTEPEVKNTEVKLQKEEVEEQSDMEIDQPKLKKTKLHMEAD